MTAARAPTGGAAAVLAARQRTTPPRTDRAALGLELDAVRAEQTALFQEQRRGGWTQKQHDRFVILGRRELEIINARRVTR